MSRQIGVAALIYGLANLLSRLIGLVREAVIGRTLGDGDGADIFRASFVLPDYLLYLLAGGAISLVFIPLFQRHRAAGQDDEGWRACAAVGNLLGLGALALIAVAWILAPIMAPGDGTNRRAALTAKDTKQRSPSRSVILRNLGKMAFPITIFNGMANKNTQSTRAGLRGR